MSKLIAKIKYYFEIKNAFATASFVLENGFYTIHGSRFEKKNCKTRQPRFKVDSKEKNDQLLKQGILKITPYKYLLMDDNFVFSFVSGKDRFGQIRKRIESNLPKLPYKTMSVTFVDSKNLIISNVVKGDQYNDNDHLWQFVDYYLRSIKRGFIEIKDIDTSGAPRETMYYPQHGDCHSKNIFWKDGAPILIDLDDVDLYPLFYDIFYYVIATKHEEAFNVFRTKRFEEKLKSFNVESEHFRSLDITDYYLSSYIYFWINKMTKRMPFHEIDFYLKWFTMADLSSYPLTSTATEEYRKNLKKLNIKNAVR